MSFTRVKPSNWPVGGTMASTEANRLDIDHANAVDKTTAGDTVAGPIQLVGPSGKITAGSGTSVEVQSGGTLQVDAGASCTVACLAAFSGGALFSAGAVGFSVAVTFTSTIGLNGTATVNGTFTMAGAGKILLGNRSLERISTNVMRTENAATSAQWQLSVAVGDTCDQELDIPHGATLTDVRVGVGTGHSPPAGTKVQLQIIRRDLIGGLTQLGGTATDPNTGSGYNFSHTFTFSAGGGGAINAVIDRTQYRYFATVIGETGSGAVAVLMAGATAIFTPASYDDGAA
jgi:hypothetical protein